MKGLSLTLFWLALATTAAAAPIVTIGENFTGSTLGQSGFRPPDTMGAVGPSHIVELINGRFAAYNKTGGLQASSSLDAFWAAAGTSPAGDFSFDPRILYDAPTDRWYATSVDNAGGANNFLVAVSNTGDPTGTWTGLSLASDTDQSNWADFPTMGIDSDALYIAANMFPLAANGPYHTAVLVLPRDGVGNFIGTPTLFEDIDPSSTGYALQPVVDLDGGSLADLNGTPVLSAYNSPAGYFKLTTLTGSAGAPVLDFGSGYPDGFLTPPPAPVPNDADQPGPLQDVDTGDSRFSGNAVLVNGAIWAVQSVQDPVTGNAAIRWFRIDAATRTIQEFGLISDPVLDLYFPSIAVNQFGQIVIGMSGSSEDDFVGAYAVAGEFFGSTMTTSFDVPMLLKSGEGSYELLDNANPPRNRWGDYSATVVDPDDPATFWTFQEYAALGNGWAIQITELNFAPIPEPGTIALFALGLAGVAAWRRRKRRGPGVETPKRGRPQERV